MARYKHPRAAADPSAGAHDHALDAASEAAPNYLRWIAELCGAHLGESVLEIGSGLGSITQYLAEGRRVVATDISENCLTALEQRFADTPNVEVRRADLRNLDLGEQFDSVVLINVLEHIYDDAGALAALRGHLKPGGTCVVYVPALNGVYGPYDREVGHWRRYSKSRLRAVAREAGLTPVHIRYVNLLAIPAWVALSLGGIKTDAGSVGRSLRVWDRYAVPLGRAVEGRIHPPIGLNLLCVSRND
jgi:SAM-dependent methyltransferase